MTGISSPLKCTMVNEMSVSGAEFSAFTKQLYHQLVWRNLPSSSASVTYKHSATVTMKHSLGIKIEGMKHKNARQTQKQYLKQICTREWARTHKIHERTHAYVRTCTQADTHPQIARVRTHIVQ